MHPPSFDRGLEISEAEKTVEDSSRVAAWLSRLGLSSRLSDYYTSLLCSSVNHLANSDIEETAPSPRTSVGIGASLGSNDVAEVAAPVCSGFAARPHVGLNSVMSMQRRALASPRSVASHCLHDAGSRTVCSGSKELAAVQSPQRALLTGRARDTELNVDSEKSECLSSSASSSSELSKPSLHVTPDPRSISVPTLTGSMDTGCGSSAHFRPSISTEASARLPKAVTAMPSEVVSSPDVDFVFRQSSVPAVEANCGENSVSTVFSDGSVLGPSCGERKTSTPARRPQTLDVIPWSPLSRSGCTSTGSVSTVVDSHVSSGSGASASTEIVTPSPAYQNIL